MDQKQTSPRVLIIYYSLSGQSRGLVNLFATGLRDRGISVRIEQIRAQERIIFPFKNPVHTFKMMLLTFFRLRVPIKDLDPACFEDHNLVVLSGPTWSYNPSGPVLSLIDRDGHALFSGKSVMPLISCRGYYRLHNYFLRKKLARIGAHLLESRIFNHPIAEPWSTIGVFLKSSGYHPERMEFLSTRYPRYGHNKQQLQEVRASGRMIAEQLLSQANPDEN